ncbi:acetyl-CoA C-acyltransferase [Microbacterium sp. MYb64]|uniref:acetyl-CoA C-acyltransferase n=1 Tax=Microbacterium sp. MYb64 TaxID=1848691 RepID=UPI000CFCBAD5|nr:acetyl-CoA C-acyltransferase [Microbacterium sp. MYb64]PRB07520.1 acetyl-CoA C-acyltransferase [Microbacterium sp. MYb64]
MSEEAVIVSVARTPIGRAYRGSLRDTSAPHLAAHAISSAVSRAGIDAAEVGDVVLGSALQQGTSGFNVGRQAALRAGMPDTVPGMSVDRQCASGLMALNMVAGRIAMGEIGVGVAGGVESISLVQNPHQNTYRARDGWLEHEVPDLYLPMLHTAEIVAERYGVTREAQDLYALESQSRTAAAQAAGRFDAEIVPISAVMSITDPESGDLRDREVVLGRDEGNRPGTELDALSRLVPVLPDGVASARSTVTAGNASQLSDGAAALVVMSAAEAERRGLEPWGRYRGSVVTGCAPGEMGIGPIAAVETLLARHGLRVDDIDLWELNEAFASQAVYCRDRLGIDPARFNVDGGAISIGHPYGMSGARMVAHALVEGRRRAARRAVVTMCIGGGMGAAALLDLA